MTDSAEQQWYFARGGQQQGPMSESALRRMLTSGQLAPTDVVWRQGMQQWAPAGSVLGLLPTLGSAPPPSPTGMPRPVMPLGYAGAPAPYGPYGSPQPGMSQDPGMRWLLPVGRSGWAIAAGYLGLLSFIIFPAPIALIISIIAIVDIRKHPQRHGMGRAIFGLVMGILGTLVLIPMLIAIASSR